MFFKSVLLLLCLSATKVAGSPDFETWNGDDFEIIDPYVGEARFFNVSNIFNSSLISIVAIFIGGIILFGEFHLNPWANIMSQKLGVKFLQRNSSEVYRTLFYIFFG